MDNLELLYKVAKSLNELRLKEEAKMPYSINLINELHINENAHSRILNVLLQYNIQGRYPIYESFVEYIFGNLTCIRDSIKIESPIFSCEEDRIDLLIKEPTNYGIIIENKVRGAGDQEKQLERYIDIVLNFGLSSRQIYVIYLTKDGTKEVSESSLTDKAKVLLEYDTESRFITINYRDDILPWLEDVVLPNCHVKETLLISAITQYIDYLKGYLNLKPQQLLVQERMDKFVLHELKIGSIEEALDVNSSFDLLKTSLENIIQKMIDNIIKDNIISPLDSYLKQFGCAVDYCSANNYDTFTLKITNKNWEKCVIRFNLEGAGFIFGVCHLDADNNHIDDELNSVINKLMPNFNQSKWWPCWKKMDRTYAPNGGDYWIKIRRGDIDIISYFKRCFDEVYNITKDLNL